MKRKYISELVGDEYLEWGIRKVFISAPTGSGKSYFVVTKLLRYLMKTGKKLLILCNRKLLRKQYWMQVLRQCTDYYEMKEAVEIRTYQEISEAIINGVDVKVLLRGYACICMDEVHYFVSDSDFNPYGTFFLLQTILKTTIKQQVIFLSATLDCVLPWIKKIYAAIQQDFSWETLQNKAMKEAFENKNYNIDANCNYKYVKCFAMADLESLCEVIGHDQYKSLFFYDDKSKADEIVEMLKTHGELEVADIAKINSDNIDDSDNDVVVNTLTMTNQIACKVLITTSVLDNGVSVHDSAVKNIVIVTESKVSFLQMLGRIRMEDIDRVNLYFIIRPAAVFAQRENEIKRVLDLADQLRKEGIYKKRFGIFKDIWDKHSESGEIYRKILVLGLSNHMTLKEQKSYANIDYGDTILALNWFALEKFGDMFMTEAKFHQYALENPLKVIWEQMAWINKEPEELIICKSTFQEKEWEEFSKMALSIKGFTKKELSEIKEKMAVQFRKTIFRDEDIRNRAFGKQKLEEFLGMVGLKLVVNIVNGRNVYTVIDGREGENNAVDGKGSSE